MGALLADRAFFEKEDVVGLLCQAELLGDKKNRPRSPPGALIQEPLDLQKHTHTPYSSDLYRPGGPCVSKAGTHRHFPRI